VFDLRVICTCDQCDSQFCALQLTALIKPDWGVLLYCFACLYHSLEVVQPSWIAVPCPTTKLGLIISKSFVGVKQGVILVALKTLLNNKVGNLYLQNFTSASAGWLCWFCIKLSPPHFTTKLRPCAHLYAAAHCLVCPCSQPFYILVSYRPCVNRHRLDSQFTKKPNK